MLYKDNIYLCFAAVAPYASYHLVSLEEDGRVKSIQHVKDVGMRVNGGFFVFRREIFDWMKAGEELVQEPFQRLAGAGRLLAYPYDGFWACMDTFKDKQLLEDLYTRGQVPWEVWKTPGPPAGRGAVPAEQGAPRHPAGSRTTT